MKDVELKPCPFCGGKAKIVCCEYNMSNIYQSGPEYRIIHSHEENMNCPIAQYGIYDALIGVYTYNTKQEAAEAWNRRVNND